MRLSTSLTKLLGVDKPIVQAPVGSASTPELVAAVSNAGAFGVLSLSWRPVDSIPELLRQTQSLTRKPFGVNLVLAWDQEHRAMLALRAGVQVLTTFWGEPSEYRRLAHDHGALIGHTVGSVEEAILASHSGVDFIIAQGWEAGGHVRGGVSTMALTPAVVDAVAPIPVLAAGGIADGRGVAAALMLGAGGAMLGTRFLLSDEAAIHPKYRERLCRASGSDAVYTDIFDHGWPNAPHRVLGNSTLRNVLQQGGRPGEGEIVAQYGDGDPIYRYEDALPRPDVVGDVEALPMYAGQSVGLLRESRPAAEIVQRLMSECEDAIASRSPHP